MNSIERRRAEQRLHNLKVTAVIVLIIIAFGIAGHDDKEAEEYSHTTNFQIYGE